MTLLLLGGIIDGGTAALILAQELGPQMGSGGSIVNIASTDAFVRSFRSIPYAESKAALLSFTRSLANILGPHGVRVNAVTPGWVDNGITPKPYEAARLTPLGRNGTPEDIARIVAFLLSPEAAFITGASIVADGGYTGVDYSWRRRTGRGDGTPGAFRPSARRRRPLRAAGPGGG